MSSAVRVFFAPTEPLGFHLDGVALTFRALFQPFGGHEGMGDAGRAGGDADDLQTGNGWRRGGRRADTLASAALITSAPLRIAGSVAVS